MGDRVEEEETVPAPPQLPTTRIRQSSLPIKDKRETLLEIRATKTRKAPWKHPQSPYLL
jgi:hypothetical protein